MAEGGVNPSVTFPPFGFLDMQIPGTTTGSSVENAELERES